MGIFNRSGWIFISELPHPRGRGFPLHSSTSPLEGSAGTAGDPISGEPTLRTWANNGEWRTLRTRFNEQPW